MRVQTSTAWIVRIATTIAVATTTLMAGQEAPPKPQAPKAQTPTQTQPGTVFRAIANSVSTNVIARDDKGQFVPDLRQDEFQVFEDGVPQKLTTFLTFVGGRTTGTPLTTAAGPPVSEGLVLPRTVPPPDASGRIFIIFIDDLHIPPGLTPKARYLLQQIRDTIVKDNDLVGFVSSGYSSIATDIQYDYHHQRFDAAIKKTTGGALSSDDIVKAPAGQEGPAGIRYMARTAFSTAMDILKNAEKITNRRKSFIYLSTGYDFDPYKDSRLKYIQDMYSVPDKGDGSNNTSTDESNNNYTDPFAKLGDSFAETDLIAEVAEIVREANRANVTFYPVDPRGLVGMMDINETLTYEEWHENLLVTTSSLQVLGEQTGGFCVCMRNDYKQAFQRIDNETSDYYMIGYNSTNPDPLKYVRKIEIKITRPGVHAENYRTEYTLKRSGKK